MHTGIEEQQALYQKRIPIFTRSVRGKFRNFKTAVLAVAYTIFFSLPWLPWTRPSGPTQPIAFDLGARRFYLFDVVMFPQDIIWLALLLAIAATLLFFVTGLVGRAFCGYFCFQTLWTDAFISIERFIQGERPARIRLYKQDWNAEKLGKLALTHAAWLVLSLATALTFVMYFGDAQTLLGNFWRGDAARAAYVTVIVLTATTYLAAGWAREQICTYMCPYARFQGVMYDPETLTVIYDEKRGEGPRGRAAPRTGLKTREERLQQGHGDCIDCGFCVQVCPTGIDIREGLQYQCISCGLCADACNTILDSMGYPRGLIRYDSERNVTRGEPQRAGIDWRRYKVVGYGVAMVSLSALLTFAISSRDLHEGSVQQVRQPLYVVMADGSIRNRYHIRISNKTDTDHLYRIEARGIPQAALDLGSLRQIKVRAGKSLTVQASVRLDPATAARTREFELAIIPIADPQHAAHKRAHFSTRTG